MSKTLNTNKSDIIRKFVLYYKDALEKEKLKLQIKKASLKTREDNLKISKEFEDTLSDRLEDI